LKLSRPVEQLFDAPVPIQRVLAVRKAAATVVTEQFRRSTCYYGERWREAAEATPMLMGALAAFPPLSNGSQSHLEPYGQADPRSFCQPTPDGQVDCTGSLRHYAHDSNRYTGSIPAFR